MRVGVSIIDMRNRSVGARRSFADGMNGYAFFSLGDDLKAERDELRREIVL